MCVKLIKSATKRSSQVLENLQRRGALKQHWEPLAYRTQEMLPACLSYTMLTAETVNALWWTVYSQHFTSRPVIIRGVGGPSKRQYPNLSQGSDISPFLLVPLYSFTYGSNFILVTFCLCKARYWLFIMSLSPNVLAFDGEKLFFIYGQPRVSGQSEQCPL